MAFDRLDSNGLAYLWGKIKSYVAGAIPTFSDITNAEIDAIITDVTPDSFDYLLDWCYPVGSYFETSVSSFNPNTSWGGTWTLDPDMGSIAIDNNATSGTVDADLTAQISAWGIANDVALANPIYRWYRTA